ncbi:MAG: cellulose synthase complex periplasmic endoglucanase BcsZ [Stagnimonas sp.]|nr:cellulose synthase complex periplasmic endoglucanase BcsZ [Stagnimonas sp.]
MKRTIAALLAAIVLVSVYLGHCWQVRHWPAWQSFAEVFVQADGRVIDRTAADRSTSEAQAYALFFALVANDRVRFEKVLHWTVNNLAAGDLKSNLPAWLWGADKDGGWGVRDANPASDADLWLAYTLIEASRLWQQPSYAQIGRGLLTQIKNREIAQVPGVGLMLLPAPQGFQAEDGSARLNPSYLPEFQFRWLAVVDPQGPWRLLWQNHVKTMKALITQGIAPDWYEVMADGRIVADRQTGSVSSYDAIRVPLWAGLTPSRDGRDNDLLLLLKPLAARLAKLETPPEKLDFQSGSASGGSPIGFSAAVLPFLVMLDEDSAVRQRLRLKNSRVDGNLGSPAHYYDQALGMFGEGWDSKRFQFDSDGRLIPKWEKSCCDWPF